MFQCHVPELEKLFDLTLVTTYSFQLQVENFQISANERAYSFGLSFN